MSEFVQKAEFNEQKCETPLPWKTGHELSLDNFLLAKNRLVSLVNQLKKDPIVLKTYDIIIKSEEAEGIIKEPPTILKPPGEFHYPPNHPVIRPEKSTIKLCVVYDASSSIEWPSRNQCLETGPNLPPKLIDILIRFHLYEVAVISDIKQAFLNVSLLLE